MTFHRSCNFGSILHTWGLHHALTQIGHQPVILDYVAPIKQWLRYYTWLFMRNPVDRAWQLAKFRAFLRRNLTLSPRLRNVFDLQEAVSKLDIAMIGGDQVWNSYAMEFSDPFLLRFQIPAGVKRVSYGSCFGRDDQPAEIEERIGSSLSAFDCLAVRNVMSQQMVRRICGREAMLVVDPTLLVDFDEVTPNGDLGKGAIVFYHLSMHSGPMQELKSSLQAEMRLPLLSVSCYSQFYGADKWAWGVGPGEWLSLFRNAECILTESFHGAIFAIKNRKPFLVYSRQNSPARFRIASLLDRYGLGDRLISRTEDATGTRMMSPIDYDRVHIAIREDVAASYSYLREAVDPK